MFGVYHYLFPAQKEQPVKEVVPLKTKIYQAVYYCTCVDPPSFMFTATNRDTVVTRIKRHGFTHYSEEQEAYYASNDFDENYDGCYLVMESFLVDTELEEELLDMWTSLRLYPDDKHHWISYYGQEKFDNYLQQAIVLFGPV